MPPAVAPSLSAGIIREACTGGFGGRAPHHSAFLAAAMPKEPRKPNGRLGRHEALYGLPSFRCSRSGSIAKFAASPLGDDLHPDLA